MANRRNIPAITFLALSFTPGCQESPKDPIVGEWGLEDDTSTWLRVYSEATGCLKFFSYYYNVEIDNSQAPTYLIEVKDNPNGPGTVLDCQFTENTLTCGEPYSFSLEKGIAIEGEGCRPLDED